LDFSVRRTAIARTLAIWREAFFGATYSIEADDYLCQRAADDPLELTMKASPKKRVLS
jgi:hypothetical protein